jgi:Ca2+-binding EF-hand superfamily protein
VATDVQDEDELASQRRDLQAAFESFDRDKSGWLSREEFLHALTAYGEPLDDAECSDLLQLIDRNADGQIDFREIAEQLLS